MRADRHGIRISDEEPTFHCRLCEDQCDGFRNWFCPGTGQHYSDRRDNVPIGLGVGWCGREKDHTPHPFAKHCECYGHNPAVHEYRQRRDAHLKKKADDSKLEKTR